MPSEKLFRRHTAFCQHAQVQALESGAAAHETDKEPNDIKTAAPEQTRQHTAQHIDHRPARPEPRRIIRLFTTAKYFFLLRLQNP